VHGRRLSVFIWILFLVVAAAVLIVDATTDLSSDARYALLSAALGATVGASEIVSRYRDEPMQALATSPAAIYMLMNAAVSAFTYGLLTTYAEAVIPALADDPLMRSIVAGFGAMAILRTKFFTLRTEGGEEVAIGPDAAVTAFLNAADRGIDRIRASRRLALVSQEAEKTLRPDAGGDFFLISLAAFQNLESEDKAKIAKIIDDMKSAPFSPDLKLRAIAYGLLNVAGERNFLRVMEGLRAYAPGEPSAGSPPATSSPGAAPSTAASGDEDRPAEPDPPA
jgi:hypothetical protein